MNPPTLPHERIEDEFPFGYCLFDVDGTLARVYVFTLTTTRPLSRRNELSASARVVMGTSSSTETPAAPATVPCAIGHCTLQVPAIRTIDIAHFSLTHTVTLTPTPIIPHTLSTSHHKAASNHLLPLISAASLSRSSISFVLAFGSSLN